MEKNWAQRRCLYAYLSPDLREILYIGKAWGVSVRGRWNRSAKEKFWSDLEKHRGINKHVVVIGSVHMPASRRLTHQLLADIESLLIHKERPWGNIQSIATRIKRPGLVVRSEGEWPGKSLYKDK